MAKYVPTELFTGLTERGIAKAIIEFGTIEDVVSYRRKRIFR
jgi:hypothetical protein